MSLRRLQAMIRKEIHHIMRDRMTLSLVILTPAITLFIMAYALTTDVKNVPIAVLDHDRSATSRAFVRRIAEGDDLALHARVDSLAELEGLLVRGAIKAAVIIDPTFGDDVRTMRGLPLQILIDGAEPQSGAFAIDHIWGRAEAFVVETLNERIRSIGAGVSLASLQPIDLRVRTLYNPGLKSRNDLIPGLISMVLGFPALSVALTLAHEREHGTLEQVMVTPVKRLELLLGKMIPYAVVGLFNVIAIPILSMIVFHVPFNGSFPLFFFLSAIFLFAMLGMGMVIGVFIRTQPAALALSFLLIFFPGFFLTGIFFPLASMPAEVQMEAMMLPGTHYATITRGIFLPGVGLDVLWPSTAALLGLGLAFTTVGVVFFKKKL